MRVATFNLENLDLPPKAAAPIEVRAAILRPVLERLRADILCLQEVNAQHVAGRPERHFVALDQLLAGTTYAGFHRVATSGPGGNGPADVHNLVTLSRFPITSSREVRHDLTPPVHYAPATAEPSQEQPAPLSFDRPLLVSDIAIGDGRSLTVINVHLKAPLAASIPGQKLSAFAWKSIGAWAEGYFISSIRRSGQALELRRLVDRLLAEVAGRLIAVVGDFNAEDHETPLRIAIGAEEDMGNGLLSPGSLVSLDRAIPADRRWSVLHHGRPQMLDHILASRALSSKFRSIEVHNESIGDEAIVYARVSQPIGSSHAAVVAEFALDAG